MRESAFEIPGATAAKQSVGRVSLDMLVTRALNLTIAVALLVFFAPVMLAIAVAILISDPGPVLFAHPRIGLNGASFPCFKFRSMVPDAAERLLHLLTIDGEARREWETSHKLRNDPRLIRIGSFLRKSSLDELPQLFNVLRGEMSIVGPRPIVAAEAERFGRYFRDYCNTLPGITGLWQISGRSDLSYRRRVALDVAYARSRTVMLDLRIMFLTVPAVLARRGSC